MDAYAFVFAAFGGDFDIDAVTMLNLNQLSAFLIEHVDRRFGAGGQTNGRAFTLGRFVFDQTQRRQASRGRGADET